MNRHVFPSVTKRPVGALSLGCFRITHRLCGRSVVNYTVLFLAFLACLGQGVVREARGEGDQKKPSKTPDCVYVPTPHDIVERMLRLAEIKKTDVVYDLGCGDGRIVVQAAKKRGCKGVGFEIDPVRVKEARDNARRNKVDHLVTIKEEDLFKADFSEATVIPIYLLPKMLKELKPKLKKLKPGTRIVSHDYAIKGIEVDKRVEMISKETGEEHILLLYKLPLREKKSKGKKGK